MQLIYVYDALCGWCYGFSPVLRQFIAAHPGDFEARVVSGGMITGERIGPIGAVAAYIKTAYRDVEQRTGVTFGRPFLDGVLEPGTAVFTSVPPARALTAFRRALPEQSVAFAAALQTAIYHDGLEPADYEAYGPIAAGFGLDSAEFVHLMQTDTVAALSEGDFQLAGRLGVTGFPTLLLTDGDQAVTFAQGYTDLATLEERYRMATEALMAAKN